MTIPYHPYRIAVVILTVLAGSHSAIAAAQVAAANPAGSSLYLSDFDSVPDGDFPPGLEFKGGGMQVDRSEGNAMLRFHGGSWFHIQLPEDLPDDFAVEFDYFTNEHYAVLYVSPFDSAMSGDSPPSYSGYRQGQFNFFAIANTSVGVGIDAGSDSLPKANAQNAAFTEAAVPVRLEVRGGQARVFVEGEQVVMHPATKIPRTDVVEFFYASMGAPGNGYVGNIRIEAL